MKSIIVHLKMRLLLTLSLFTGPVELLARNVFQEKPTFHSAHIEIILEDRRVDRFEKRVRLIWGIINLPGLVRIKKEMVFSL